MNESKALSPGMDWDQFLSRLVALNQERAQEEAEGKIRWLRPEYQAPKDQRPPEPKTARLMPAPEIPSKPGAKTGTVPRGGRIAGPTKVRKK